MFVDHQIYSIFNYIGVEGSFVLFFSSSNSSVNCTIGLTLVNVHLSLLCDHGLKLCN